MKASNGPVKQAGWREYSQGGVVAGLMVVSLYAVASNCVQIDAAPKVADYYNQYRDYRDQYNQVVDWKDRVDTSGLMALMPEGMQGASDLLEERYQAANGFYEAYQNGLEGVQGEHAIASMRQQGPLTRAEWANGVNAPNDDPKLCYQLDMGADIGLMAQTGEPNTLSQRCGPEGRQALANHSVRPSRDGSGMAPNTAQATEVTRAVMGGEFSMLDVVRGDLAWLRDNPEYHTPFRYPRESFDISPEEAARHSAALQRVGGIMAGRGFAAFGYEPLRLEQSGLVDTESAYGATTLLARLNLVYDGMGRYATAYPRVAGLRDTLLDFDSNMIDAANEGERHGIDLQLRALEGDLSALRVESRQREERLMGTLLSEYVSEQSTGLRGGQAVKSDEALLLFALVFVGMPLGIWMFQDSIFGFFQMVDSLLLKAYSFLPFIGGYYSAVDGAYNDLAPEQLTWQHIWIAGQIAWRPVALLLLVPMMLNWAWKAWKRRRAQAFNDITKDYILKHCGTKQTAADCGARQQWVVRRWYQYYGLHRMRWGSAEWNMRLRRALSLQLGKPSDHPESLALLNEFATFIHGQVEIQFGKKQADSMPPETMVEEATKGHAFSATAMVRVLAAARDTFGVVSPQGFRNRLFQTPETVPIWFALNGLTRQTTHAESLGVLSHFYVEVAEDEPITEPQMDNAIDGMEKYRKHLIDQRKLKDLDESEAYAEQERREARKATPKAALEGAGDAGYAEDQQKIA